MSMLPDVLLGLSFFAVCFFAVGAWAAVRHGRKRAEPIGQSACGAVDVFGGVRFKNESICE
jgi:hypothetical protein